uniref:Putative secreted protein n=1 Tax=Anopheles darlingi TaxID=43151 RepID=A0A2M4D7U2_ANODA
MSILSSIVVVSGSVRGQSVVWLRANNANVRAIQRTSISNDTASCVATRAHSHTHTHGRTCGRRHTVQKRGVERVEMDSSPVGVTQLTSQNLKPKPTPLSLSP